MGDCQNLSNHNPNPNSIKRIDTRYPTTPYKHNLRKKDLNRPLSLTRGPLFDDVTFPYYSYHRHKQQGGSWKTIMLFDVVA